MLNDYGEWTVNGHPPVLQIRACQVRRMASAYLSSSTTEGGDPVHQKSKVSVGLGSLRYMMEQPL